jgi:hypothetical protein
MLETAASNPEWEHVYCVAVLTANTSMRGVEVKHVRRKDVDLEKVWDVESATGKGVLYVGHSKNETSKRTIPLNGAARDAITRMLKRADELVHADPEHCLWCASQHHRYDSTKAAREWDGPGSRSRRWENLVGFPSLVLADQHRGFHALHRGDDVTQTARATRIPNVACASLGCDVLANPVHYPAVPLPNELGPDS